MARTGFKELGVATPSGVQSFNRFLVPKSITPQDTNIATGATSAPVNVAAVSSTSTPTNTGGRDFTSNPRSVFDPTTLSDRALEEESRKFDAPNPLGLTSTPGFAFGVAQALGGFIDKERTLAERDKRDSSLADKLSRGSNVRGPVSRQGDGELRGTPKDVQELSKIQDQVRDALRTAKNAAFDAGSGNGGMDNSQAGETGTVGDVEGGGG
jgi:hypothetical protein